MNNSLKYGVIIFNLIYGLFCQRSFGFGPVPTRDCEPWVVEHLIAENKPINDDIRNYFCGLSKEQCIGCVRLLQNRPGHLNPDINSELCNCEPTPPEPEVPPIIIYTEPPSPRVLFCHPQTSRGNPRNSYFTF